MRFFTIFNKADDSVKNKVHLMQPVTDLTILGSVAKVVGSWEKVCKNAESVMKSMTRRYSNRQVVMAIMTKRRVGDVFCKASHRSIMTNPKPLIDKLHHKQTSRKAWSMFLTLPNRTDCFCGLVSRVRIQNRDPYHTI